MTLTHTLRTDDPYVSYSYAYPHKSAYRTIAPVIQLEDAWRDEDQRSLFLYFHVPFCEFRCGFCNLFTIAQPERDLVDRYLDQIEIESQTIRNAIPKAHFSRFAIGGGTPTFLNERQLERFLKIVRQMAGPETNLLPTSCEASPATLSSEKAAMLKVWGVTRLSLGVQSFDHLEVRSMGRPQKRRDVYQAIDFVRENQFPILNLDLIYGAPEQTLTSWRLTVDEALQFQPEEIFLYPLYVRQLTGLDRISRVASSDRLDYYRQARDQLLSAGYVQQSMRMFQKADESSYIDAQSNYCCQSDGMVGVGCGARSYTRTIHYSTEFAVGRAGVRSILLDYLNRTTDEFAVISHGFQLDIFEQRRRYLIISLLNRQGVDLRAYQNRFGSDLLDDFPQLDELIEQQLAISSSSHLLLTPNGLELSDAIGPWLYSADVRQLSTEFQLI